MVLIEEMDLLHDYLPLRFVIIQYSYFPLRKHEYQLATLFLHYPAFYPLQLHKLFLLRKER